MKGRNTLRAGGDGFRLPQSGRILTGLVVLFCLCLPLDRLAEGAVKQPWHWLLSLRSGEHVALGLPTSLYVDEGKDRYYVVDSGNQTLLSFDKDGNFLKSFDAQGALQKPFDMVRLAGGHLVVVEKGGNTVTRIDLRNKTTDKEKLFFQGREILADRLEFVENRLYVLDRASGDVFGLDDNLKVVTRYGAPQPTRGIVDFFVQDGSVWFLGQLEKRLTRVGADGKVLVQLELGGSVSFPVSFTMDGSGNAFVLDRHRGEVVVYNGRGQESYRFLGKGHGREKLYFPNEIRFDHWGRLCVVDEGNARVEIFSR